VLSADLLNFEASQQIIAVEYARGETTSIQGDVGTFCNGGREQAAWQGHVPLLHKQHCQLRQDFNQSYQYFDEDTTISI
jgi:hypothetical protein